MTDIPLIDSCGLEVLLDNQERFVQSGGTFKLAAPTELCLEILEITRVAECFEIHRDVKSAVGSFLQ